MGEIITPKGFIQAKIRHKNGKVEHLNFKNQVLDSGKMFLADCLLERATKPLFITNVLFGDGGTNEGQPKEVQPMQGSLYGVVRLKKSVVAQIDPELPSQAIFTVVISENEGNDHIINEMGLELSNEKLFSLSTFPDFNKTDQMEVAWSWFVCFV